MLDLEQAVTIARATESSEQEVELMASKGTKEDPFVLNRLGTTMDGGFEDKKIACYRCGNEGHKAESCQAHLQGCRKCGKIGHLARVCHSKKRNSSSMQRSEQQKWNLKRNGKK